MVTPPPDSAPRSKPRYKTGDWISDKYRLIELVGKGGMGTVWQAMNVEISLCVAIKIVHPHLRNEGLLDRLRGEAQVASQLVHPGLVRAFDFGHTEQGDPFLVLEWLEGRNLADVIDERGPIPPETAARLFVPLGAAVAALHEQGIVHRDIKPENILVSEDDAGRISPKLVDFGIAVNERDRAEGTSEECSGVFGTPGYLSPEQAQEKELDGRSDVWSFCVCFVETLSAEAFCTGDGLASLMTMISDPTCLNLKRRYPSLPPELLQILQSGLTPDPAERVTMRDLVQELASWLQTSRVKTDITGFSLARYVTNGPLSASRALLSSRPPAPEGLRREQGSARPGTVMAPEIQDEATPQPVLVQRRATRSRQARGGKLTHLIAATCIGVLATAGILLARNAAVPPTNAARQELTHKRGTQAAAPAGVVLSRLRHHKHTYTHAPTGLDSPESDVRADRDMPHDRSDASPPANESIGPQIYESESAASVTQFEPDGI